ncbi:Hypothetical protein SRAE_2000223500 [Strongyloides ratti]|uniref:Uncharacterized protein n=1 Tax=Strongyloides ratti TaxID=34506 RepID=A0A090LHE7_STRRB|nr:Hypothetical protein SRAE_2000223500 [Strongyloides ratti]CEF67573.1 Hypothetical protein SRAE_2000223500 [Strongyloides ratti]
MSTIKIKRHIIIPWRSISRDQSNNNSNVSITNDNKNDSHLKTSQFSNLSKISADTPPSYSVSENSVGEMVSQKRGVTWPNRPLTGYYSIKEHKKRKAFIQKKTMDQKKVEKKNTNIILGEQKQEKVNSKSSKKNIKCMSSNDNSSSSTKSTSEKEKKVNEEKESMKFYQFCGTKSPEEIEKLVLYCNTYYLFYNNKRENKLEIPYEIPLKAAYFNQKTKKVD